MKTMYEAIANSPETMLKATLNATDTTISVVDVSVLPQAPNLVCVGSGDTTETIRYGAIDSENNLLLNCERGFQGVASKHLVNTRVSRNFTAYDNNTFKENIEALKVDVDGLTDGVNKAESKISEIESGVLAVGNAIKFNGLLSSQFVRSDADNEVIQTKGIEISSNNSDTRFGYNTLLTSGINNKNNTAFGYKALENNATGMNNTGVGRLVLNANKEGIENTAIGSATLSSNENGSRNVAIGRLAGTNIQAVGNTGATDINDSTYVGCTASPSANIVNNEIVIGAFAVGKGNNTAHIGNSSVSTISYGAGTGTSFTNRSDERLKEDIELANLDLCYENIIKKLPIKRFKYINEFTQESDKYKLGFIAQDFEKVLPKSVHKSKAILHRLDKKGKKKTKVVRYKHTEEKKDEDGNLIKQEVVEEVEVDDVYETNEEMLSIDVSQLLPMTIGAVQKLAQMVEEQQEMIKTMQERIKELAGENDKIS